jgi:hypothetical protein
MTTKSVYPVADFPLPRTCHPQPAGRISTSMAVVFTVQVVFTVVLLLLGVSLPAALGAAIVLLVADAVVIGSSAAGLRRLLQRLTGPAVGELTERG